MTYFEKLLLNYLRDSKVKMEITGLDLNGFQDALREESKHRLELIAAADWIIDMGPEGGYQGGEILFTGTPDQLAKEGGTETGQYLRQYSLPEA